MVKVLALIPQRPDISREEFHSHWLSPHGEIACRIDTLQRYVQCHRIRPGIPGLAEADYEGIAEVWFKDFETAAAMGEHPVYANEVHPDEASFIDGERLAFVFADESEQRPGPDLAKDAPTVKALILLRRAASTDPDSFGPAWADADPEGDRFPQAIRTVRSVARPENYAEGESPFDGFAELWWRDRESFEADWERDGDGYLEALAKFADLDGSSGFLSEEVRLIWP